MSPSLNDLPSAPSINRVVHPLAVATAAATLLLIFMGGLVTSHGAGMSVPDWPNSYGYNMFTFPVSKWVGGIFYEHTHRLMGSLVGLCSLLMFLHAWGVGATRPRNTGRQISLLTAATLSCWILCAVALACLSVRTVAQVELTPTSAPPHTNLMAPAESADAADVTKALKLVAELSGLLGVVGLYGRFCRHPDTRPLIRGLTLAVLVGVIFQGLLGGFRVVLIQLGLAIIHACVAQAFLCLVALLAVVASPRWASQRFNPIGLSPALVRWIAISVIAIYGQLIIGALMRHNQAGLAIPDLPLAYGHLLPPTDADQLSVANGLRLSGDPRYSFPGVQTVTLPQVWLNFAHRCGAVIVTALLGSTLIWILRKAADPALRRPALLLAGLLATQVTLGWLTIAWRKPADVASLHVAVGATTLVTTFILYVRARRGLQSRRSVAEMSANVPYGSMAVPA